MAGLLPIAAASILGLIAIGWPRWTDEAGTTRRRLLMAAAGLAGLVITASELLSLFHRLDFQALTIFWSALLVILLIFGLRSGTLVGGLQRLRSAGRAAANTSSGERLLLAAAACVALVLLLIALQSPPNTVDSLQYHMARVAHWAQNHSLRHYAATYHPQLWNAIGAEIAVLHLYVLARGDLLANLVQWAAMLGSAVAVSLLTAELGGSRRAQWLAMVFGASAPVALLQATSTQTDYAAGFWVVTTAALLLPVTRRSLTVPEWAATGLSQGVGMLTKGTFYPIAAAMVLLLLVWGWRAGRSLPRLARGMALVASLALALNLGYWWRNVVLYGGPFGNTGWIATRTAAGWQPMAPFARLLQESVLNLATPWPGLNDKLAVGVQGMSVILGSPQPAFDLIWAWNHEDLAGSPLHLIAFPIGLWIAAGTTESRTGRRTLGYALAVLAAFAAFSWLIAYNPYGLRHHIPLFLLWGPVLGVGLQDRVRPNWATIMSLGLLATAVPWIVFNSTRPLVGWVPRTRAQSVFEATRRELLFANVPELRQPYTLAAQAVLASGCHEVGTSLDSRDPEYALWWLLGAPARQIEIQSVRPLPSLEHVRDPAFRPCAVFCTNCGDRQVFDGLPLDGSFGHVRVYSE